MTRVPPWWLRTGAYLLVVGMFAFAIWRVEQVHLDSQAEQCIHDWTTQAQIRKAVGLVAMHSPRTSTDILLAFAGPRVNHDEAARFHEVTDVLATQDAVAVRKLIPDPTCNLAAAERRL